MSLIPSRQVERPPDTPADEPAPAAQPKRGRKGATALEYLVMLSFILVALVWAVQHVGYATRGLFSNAAAQAPNGQLPDSSSDSGTGP